MKKGRRLKKQGLIFEELDPRLLLSADPLSVFFDASANSVHELVISDSEANPALNQIDIIQAHSQQSTSGQSGSDQSTSSARKELVIIDSRAPNYQQLYKDALKVQSEGREVHVIVLDAHRDGIKQISEVLERFNNLDAVHIVSHSDAGQLNLGATQLNNASLKQRSDDIAQWKQAFSEDGDVLIYGCNLASNAEGTVLIDGLSQLTGTDIAASDDLTGDQLKGGDWDLEYQSGDIETNIAFSEDVQQNWRGILEATAEAQPTISAEPVQKDVTYEEQKLEEEQAEAALVEDAQALAKTEEEKQQSSLAEELRQEIVFIDESVTDYQSFIDDLQNNSNESTAFEIIVLDSRTDGVEQISNVLSAYDDVDAVHIFSHGDDGAVQLGNIRLNADNITDYNDSLATWDSAFDESADILIYGCNLAESESGEQFVNQLASITSADVAASDDLTGSSELGGDWELEYNSGQIEADTLMTDSSTGEWQGLLVDQVIVSYEPAFSDMNDTSNEVKTALGWGQTFIYNSPDTTYDVSQIDLVIHKTAGADPGQTITVTLRDSFNGTILGSATVSSDNLATSETWVSFDIGSATLSDNVQYVIQVESDGAGKVYIGVNPLASYANGDLLDKDGNIKIGEDAAFRVISPNTPPVATGNTVVASEDSPLVIDESDFLFTDAESDALTSVTISVLNLNGGSLTHSSGTVTVTNGMSITAAQLADLTFTSALNDSTNSSFSYTVNDADPGTVSAVMGITVNAVNDAPSGADKTVTAIEDTDYVFTTADFGFTDVEIDVLLKVVIATAPTNGALYLDANLDGVIDGGETLIVTDVVAVSDITSGKLKFQPVANENGTAYDSFTFQVQDDGGVANGGVDTDQSANTITIDVSAVNDAPLASNLSAAESYTEDTALNLIDIVVTDVDSANVTATLTLSDVAAGSLSTATSGGVTSTFVGGVWTASGAIADVNALLAGVTFNPALNYNSNFNILTSVDDGTAPAITGTKVVTATAVNDAPLATNLSAAEGYTEDTALNLADIVITDVDSANVTATLTLSDAGAGTLSTATSGAVTSTFVGGVWTASGAISDVNTLLANVSFNPVLNYNSNFSIATSVDDGIAPAVTGVKVMTGNAVNDAPVATNSLVTGAEDTNYVFVWSDFNITDVDTDISDTTATQITLLPVTGALEYFNGSSWVAVSVNQVITKDSIDAGDLRFVPLTDESGTNYAQFSYAPVQTEVYVTLNSGATTDGVLILDSTGANPELLGGASTFSITVSIDNATTPGSAGLFSYASASDDNQVLLYPKAAGDIYVTAGGVGATISTGIDFYDGNPHTLTLNWNGADGSAELIVDGNSFAFTGTTGTIEADGVLMIGQEQDVVGVLITNEPFIGDITHISITTDGTLVADYDMTTDGSVIYDTVGTLDMTIGGDAILNDVSTGNAVTMTVDITSVNDAPSGADKTVTTNEDTDYVFAAADFGFTDVETDVLINVVIATGPSNGTLYLDANLDGVIDGGETLVATDVVAVADIASGKLKFQPAADANGTAYDSFTFQVQDDGGVANGGVDTDQSANTITIDVSAVNDAPLASNLSAAEGYTEDTALNLIDIVVTDVDSANVTATLTLSDVAAGSLSTATSGAVTSTFVGGVWTASGAIADVNALLAGVNFNPALNYNSNFNILTSVDDGVAPAITGAKVVTATAVNDAPLASNLSAAESYTEDTALNLTDIVVSDVDSANATVTLTLSDTNAGSLNTATSGAVTSTFVGGVWTASGAISDVNVLLAGVMFNPALNYDSNFSIATSVDDGVAAAVTGTKVITGNAINDAPTATNLSAAESYTEDTLLNLTDIVVTDVDNTNTTVTLTLSDLAAGNLSTATSGAVTSTFVGGVWTASGLVADVNVLLAGVTFNPALHYNSNFTIATSVDDGTAPVVTGTKVITGSAVNDTPTLITNNPLPVSEESTVTITTAYLEVTDVDNTADQLVYTLISIPAAGDGTVRLNGTTLGVNDTFTQDDINNNLVTYRDADDGANTSFQFTISDGTATLPAIIFSVNGAPVNDAPVNTVPVNATATEEIATAIAGISITDIDANGGNLTTRLQITNGVLNVSLSGSATISIGANGSNDLTILGTVTDINATLASLTYTGNTDVTGINSDTLTITTNDGGNTGSGGPLQDVDNVQIDITNVNDAPIATNLNAAESYTEDIALNITDIVVSDVDSTNTTVTLTLSDVTAGALSTATSGAVTSTFVGGVWTASGAITDVNALLAGVTFNPALNYNSNFNILTSVDDGVATAITGTKAITVTAVNDAPIIASTNAISVVENQTAAITVIATDVEVDALTFSISGGADAALFSITTGGVLTFNTSPDFETPTDNNTDNVYEVIVQVDDGNGGTDSQAISVTVTNANELLILSKETVDLDGDGFIDAIHITFNTAINDSTVVASDWNVAGVNGEAFSSTTNGDTANDEDIYITFGDGTLDTAATPDAIYTQGTLTDLSGNLLASDSSSATWGDADSGMITFDGGNGVDNARAIVMDSVGNTYVAGNSSSNGSDNDFIVRKYDANGDLDLTWGDSNSGMVTYDGGNTDLAFAITIDASNNIYVAGYSDTGTDKYLIVRKYDANGDLDLSWGDSNSGMISYDGGNGDDRADGITIDASNNIYIAGSSSNGTDQDLIVRKYDANGDLDLSWGDSNSGMVTFDSGTGDDRARSIAINASGDIYVSGNSSDGSNQDLIVRKYDANGDLDLSWGDSNSGMVTYDSGNGLDSAFAITLDASNNVYVVGDSSNGTDQDLIIRKYDANGDLDLSWGDSNSGMVTFDGGNGADRARSVTLSSSGNIYVAGYSSNGSDFDFIVRKYDANGDLATDWGDSNSGMITYDGGNGHDLANEVIIDASDNIYVSGYSSNGTDDDFIVRKYDSNGDLANKISVATIDKAAPVASITRDDTDNTTATSVTFSVDFSEDVSNVDATDFALNLTGLTANSTVTVGDAGDTDASTYTVTVDSIADATVGSDGTLGLDIAGGTDITDQVGVAINTSPIVDDVYTFVHNDAPSAVDDTTALNGTEDSTSATLNATLLVNDSDPNGDSFSITTINGTALVGGIQNIAVTNGTVNIDALNNITFTADTNYNGAVSFTYTISDGALTNTATASGTITAINDAPTAVNDVNSTDENSVLNVTTPGVLANDSDVDVLAVTTGTTLNYDAANDNDATWNDDNATAGFDWAITNFGTDVTHTTTPTTAYSGITDAYQFTGTGGGLTDGFENLPSDPSTASASFEIWFRPNVLSGQQMLFETGGATVGTSIYLDGANLIFATVDGGLVESITVDLSALYVDPTAEFIQLVGVIDITDNQIELFIDGFSRGTAAFTGTDWAGSNGSGLGRVSAQVAEGSGNLNGDIAVFRFYESALTSTEVNNNFQAIASVAIQVSEAEGLAGNVGNEITLASGALLTVNANGSYDYNPNGQFEYLSAGASITDSFSYTVSDGSATDTATVTITINGVSDAPTATNLSAAESYTEDTPLNLINIVVSDIDSATATVTLTLSDTGSGILNTATSGAVTSTFIGGVWTASGAIANVNALLAGVTFNPALNYSSNFNILTSVDDGTAPAITGTKVITATTVNDAPLASNLNAAESYTEDTLINLTDIVITDVDSANVTATLTLSDVAAGSLSTATSGAVTSTFVGGVWTAIGAIADVNTLLSGVTFNPSLNYNSNFNILTNVDDGVAPAITGTKVITATAVNDAPVANDDSSSVNEGQSVTVNLATNDTDADNALDLTSIVVVSGPSNGAVVINANGTVDYTHDGSETIADSFTYTILDASGAVSNTATVSLIVNPINDAPTAQDDTPTAVNEGGTKIFNLAANDSDAENALDLNSITIMTAPSSGTLTVNGDGTVTYTHNGSETLTDSFTYIIADISGSISNAATVNITVNPVNDAPVAGNDTAIVDQFDSVAINLSATDSDVDDGLDLNSLTITSGPANGTLIINADGTVIYNHDGSNTLSDSFSYTISDISGLVSNVATVNITVNAVNTAPTSSGIADVTVNEDSANTVIDLNSSFDDLENLDSELTYSIIGNSNIGLFNIANIDASGQLILDYAANLNGSAQISIRATDTEGSSVDTLFVVTVTPTNDIPVLITNTGLDLNTSSAAVITGSHLSVNDIDNVNSETIYAITAIPTSGDLLLNGIALSINSSFTQADLDSGRVSYQSNGASTGDSFGFSVIDASGGVGVSSTFNMVVQLAQVAQTEDRINTDDGYSGDNEKDTAEDKTVDDSELTDEKTDFDNEFIPVGGSVILKPPVLTTIPPTETSVLERDVLKDVLKETLSEKTIVDSNVSTLAEIQLQSLESFWQAIDLMKQEMNEAINEKGGVDLRSTAVESSGVVLTAGIVAWVLRSGALLTSLMTTIPLWKGYDPLTIVAYKDDEEEEEEEEALPVTASEQKEYIKKKQKNSLESKVESIFSGPSLNDDVYEGVHNTDVHNTGSSNQVSK